MEYDVYAAVECGYDDGWRAAISGAAEIAAEADARIAELEAECARLRGIAEVAAEQSAARADYDALGDQEGNFTIEDERKLYRRVRDADAKLDAALATPDAGATPTPQ